MCVYVCVRVSVWGVEGRQPSAASSSQKERKRKKESCTSHTHFGLRPAKAATISREINYDVTQRRPEGAARLHTLHPHPPLPSPPSNQKKTKKKKNLLLHPLHTDGSKPNLEQQWSRRKRKGGLGGGWLFSFSYMDDSKIPAAFKKDKKNPKKQHR